eukprot:TRINITY_DN3864_c0_g1_i1.p1 TRINITY_DN3864_c0_g1~~TRINITY_DN3864_c0_g1_i1.p1  ORF type:complete len:227 (+),score=25.12 TRINITY_DN3864_c0_g1_i1:19-699(+)
MSSKEFVKICRVLEVIFTERVNQVRQSRRPVVASVFRNLNTSVKKTEWVTDWVTGMTLKEAIMQTTFHRRKSAHLLNALLRKAEHNAINALQMDRDRLIVTSCWVGRGQPLKQMWIRAKGRASIRVHPYTHLFVKVKEGSQEDVEAIETYQNFKKVGLDRFVSYRNRLARVGQASPPPEAMHEYEEWQKSLGEKPNRVAEIIEKAMAAARKERIRRDPDRQGEPRV